MPLSKLKNWGNLSLSCPEQLQAGGKDEGMSSRKKLICPKSCLTTWHDDNFSFLNNLVPEAFMVPFSWESRLSSEASDVAWWEFLNNPSSQYSFIQQRVSQPWLHSESRKDMTLLYSDQSHQSLWGWGPKSSVGKAPRWFQCAARVAKQLFL